MLRTCLLLMLEVILLLLPMLVMLLLLLTIFLTPLPCTNMLCGNRRIIRR